MEVTILLTADYANSTDNGKLNVMGIFTRIFTTDFPVLHPEMYLIIQLTAGAAEYGREIKLEVKLLDEDANEILNIKDIKHQVPREKSRRIVNINQIIRLQGLVFEKAGSYEFSVLVDGDLKGALPLEVEKTELPN